MRSPISYRNRGNDGRSAWRLEARRLGDEEMGLLDVRTLRNRVFHGVAMSSGLAGSILVFYGPVALFAFLLQAFSASRLLEAVNYLEHWGLTRDGRRVTPLDSWDSYNRFTYYTLTGLARHADHHAEPSRPFQQLRTFDEAPRLPRGYIGTLFMVFANKREFQRLVNEQLKHKRLGPCANPTPAAAAGPATVEQV